MTNKNTLQTLIKHFASGDLKANALALFKELGYQSPRTLNKPINEILSAFNPEKALFSEWLNAPFLFQLAQDNLTNIQSLLTDVDGTIIESYLFVAIELEKPDYSRTQLVTITRELNKSPQPVLILFKHGDTLTLSVIHRRLHKRDDSRDVLEKVTLLKDIRINEPHRAHLDILAELAFAKLNLKANASFVDLHNAWQTVLDTKTLNKQFYKEISQWYFWAMKEVYFPDAEHAAAEKGSIFEDEHKVREHNAKNLIRLLTRLLFVWFIKEKNLIPEQIFNEDWINGQLNGFKPQLNSKANGLFQGNDSHYYRAILQNLFFATLNQTSHKREFRKDGQHRNVTNLMRYQTYFKQPQAFLTLMKDVVPFMNGGLFDCLDKPVPALKGKQGGEVIAFEDGFSDRPDNTLKVPDYIFFGTHTHIDLSEELGNKQKSVEIKGLIDILKSYKFTITENTPIEEDIALDPELLGQVFENLLASYNPETKTTARKQTGSFYTPREIVDYMVDESLLAYFLTVLTSERSPIASAIGEEKIAEAILLRNLRALLSYNALENPFNEEQTTALINGIDSLKVLDPACGSGAFPMGVLHKLVHCLYKLDPQNLRWKARQSEKINAIDDAELREKALQALDEAFDNEIDYGRKLFLIENCIYGVDIQAIAIQISKLRFFISLIVDQKVDRNKTNFGVIPLPNLETKFVAANTLIGIKKPNAQLSLFDDKDLEALEDKLKKVRHSLFSAKTKETKDKYRNEDKQLREQIGNVLIQHGWGNATAGQLAQWNPYDQNANADFFDVQWMFGENGFDIVLGNPPYVQIQKFSGQQCQKEWQAQNYQTFQKTGDIYALFIEKGVSLLKQHGLLAFITSNKWMRAGYGKSLRNFLATKTQPLKLIDFGSYQVFDAATVDSNILITRHNVEKSTFNACTIQSNFIIEKPLADYFAENSQIMPLISGDVWVISSGTEQQIKAKIEAIGTPLKDWDVNINYGIKTGFNEAFIIDTPTKERLCNEDPKSAEIIKPILRGCDIKRYSAKDAGLWLIFIPWHFPLHEDSSISGVSEKAEIAFVKEYPSIYQHLTKFKNELSARNKSETGIRYEWYALQRCAATYYDEFAKAKIVWGNLALDAQYGWADKDVYVNAPCTMITPANKYILAVLNSTVSDYYIRKLGVTRNGGYFEYKPMFIEQLPIPKISIEQQQPFIQLVDYILFIKKQPFYTSTDLDFAEERLMSNFFENLIDALVYELYFPEELHEAKKQFMSLVVQENLPDLDSIEGDKVGALKQIVRRLTDKNHPLYNNLFFLDSVPVVRIIEGKA